MKDNKFLSTLIMIFVPAILVTIVGMILFGGFSRFITLRGSEFYLYSLSISIFVIMARVVKTIYGTIPALLIALVFAIILRSYPEYKTVPFIMLFLPMWALFNLLNSLVGFLFKERIKLKAKAILFGIGGALSRTLIFFITQLFFKNVEMFNWMYQIQQGLILFLTIGVGITLSDMLINIEPAEEVDIVEKVKHYMDDDE